MQWIAVASINWVRPAAELAPAVPGRAIARTTASAGRSGAWIRSPVISRSNWARFRVSRPMLVVVLKAWVTEMKETPCASNSSTSLAKSASERVSGLRSAAGSARAGREPANSSGGVMAKRIQAAAFGDLDRAILRRLREPRDKVRASRDTLVPLHPAGPPRARASGSSPELCWSVNGTAVWSGS